MSSQTQGQGGRALPGMIFAGMPSAMPPPRGGGITPMAQQADTTRGGGPPPFLAGAASGAGPRPQAFSPATGGRDGGAMSLPDLAGGQIARTTTGQYLGAPTATNIQGLGLNPYAGVQNPYANVSAGVTPNVSAGAVNPYANVFNPYAGVQNPYLAGDPNPYIGNIAETVARQVVPGVKSAFAASGRSGGSPIEQQAISRGIADALSPFLFGTAESERARRVAAGETEAGRLYGAGESLAQRAFGAGEAGAGRRFTAGETEAGRGQTAEERRVQREFQAGADVQRSLVSAGESQEQRRYLSGEAQAQRGQSAYEAERGRQLQAAGMAPAVEQARYTGPQAELAIGAREREQEQRGIDEAIARWDYEQNLPARSLTEYLDRIQGTYGNVISNLASGAASQMGVKTGK